MMPGNVLSTEPKGGELLYPDNVPTTPMYDLEMGGVALNNPNQGLDLKPWVAWVERYNGIFLKPIDGSQPTTHPITSAGISLVSLAFDTNMQPAIAYVENGVVKFYWFDSTVPGFVTTTYADVRSPRVSTDDKRGLLSGTTDVIFAYIKNGTLCWRMQRERYTVERTTTEVNIPDDVELVRVGMNSIFRLQYELRLKNDI